jgi:polar amino acid transport system substrate-binding protein
MGKMICAARSVRRSGAGRLLFLICSFLLLAFSLTSCSPTAAHTAAATPVPSGELASVLNSGTLVIATESAYPPQSQLNPDAARAASTRCDQTQYTANQLSGYDIDVAVEIARRLGVEPCFVTPTWSQVVAGNWGDRWDINVGSMVITDERMQNLYFTQPYISGAAVLFVHKNNQAFKSPADLSGKRIGICTGCAYEDYLHGALNIPGEKIDYVIQDAQVVGYDTDTSALADLAEGDSLRLDAVLTDPDTGASAIRSGLPIKQLGEALYHDYSAVAVDKRSGSDPLPLVERISALIQEMHQDGTLLKFSQKYYGADFTTPAAQFDLKALGQIP